MIVRSWALTEDSFTTFVAEFFFKTCQLKDVIAPGTPHRPPTRNSQNRSPGVMLLIPGTATPTEKTTADIISMLG
ncbi:MAG: hypothetical protein WAM42_06420 [Candidatus Nitrosopolaris sp.]